MHRTLLLAMVVLLGGGCTTVHETVSDHPIDQVWIAMKVAAREPRIPDWHIDENNVWVDESARRIEIERRLRRDFISGDVARQRQERNWKLSVYLHETRDGSEIEVISRDWGVPVQALEEGKRYIGEIRALLSGEVPGVTVAPAAPITPAPPPPANDPAAKPSGKPVGADVIGSP